MLCSQNNIFFGLCQPEQWLGACSSHGRACCKTVTPGSCHMHASEVSMVLLRSWLGSPALTSLLGREMWAAVALSRRF